MVGSASLMNHLAQATESFGYGWLREHGRKENVISHLQLMQGFLHGIVEELLHTTVIKMLIYISPVIMD